MKGLRERFMEFERAVVKALSDQSQLKVFLLVMALGLVFCSVCPRPALAWDPNQAVNSILGFLKLLIIVSAAVVAVMMVIRSQIIPAVVVVLAASFLYVVLDPNIMSAIGEGLKTLFKLSG